MPPSKGFVTHCYECPKCTFINTIVELDPTRQAEGWIRSELPPHQIEPMRLITKKWTEEDVARLSVLLEEGATLLRAASALNRGTSSVQKKARELGKSFAGVRLVRAGLRSTRALEPAPDRKGRSSS
jgi:hypothetical protein